MTMLGMDASLAVLGAFALGLPAAGNFRSAQTMSTSSATTPRLTRIPFFIFITLFQAGLKPATFFRGRQAEPRTLQRELIQKTKFTRQPGQPVQENQSANKQQQNAAQHFHSVEMAPETLVKTQESVDSDGGQQERNSKSGGIDG